MHRVEKGLVLRVVPYRDADVMLTILTECQGKITAAARGVRRKSSRISAVYHRSSSVRTVCTGCSFNRRKLGTDQFRMEVFKS